MRIELSVGFMRIQTVSNPRACGGAAHGAHSTNIAEAVGDFMLVRNRAALALLCLLGIPVGLLVWWLMQPAPLPEFPTGPRPGLAELAELPPETPAAVSDPPETVPSVVAAPSDSSEPAPSLEDSLVQALLQADAEISSSGEVLEARRLLEKVLRNHPELVLSLAGALAQMQNRELAFAVARLLARSYHNAAVRAQLHALAAHGDVRAREAALYALVGATDAPAAAVAAASFEDAAAPAGVRTAAAVALVDMLPVLAPSEREAVQATARQLLRSSAEDLTVRSEAIGLLDPSAQPDDRAELRTLLETSGTPPELVMASARSLLSHDEPPESVLPSLQRLALELPDGPLKTSLQAILDELQ